MPRYSISHLIGPPPLSHAKHFHQAPRLLSPLVTARAGLRSPFLCPGKGQWNIIQRPDLWPWPRSFSINVTRLKVGDMVIYASQSPEGPGSPALLRAFRSAGLLG